MLAGKGGAGAAARSQWRQNRGAYPAGRPGQPVALVSPHAVVAQLAERLLPKQEVAGSRPASRSAGQGTIPWQRVCGYRPVRLRGNTAHAVVAQLAAHHLAKVGVGSSNLLSRSRDDAAIPLSKSWYQAIMRCAGQRA